MKTFVIIALLLVSTWAVSMKRPLSNAQIQKFESLKKDNKWAGIMMNLAELHIMSQGPLDQLVDAIEEVVQDIDNKTDRAHSDYENNTIQHEAEVARIQGQIDSANEDIAHTTEFLNNVLYVQRQNLQQDIVNYEQNIEKTKNYMTEQAQLRQQEHVRFNEIIEDHQGALAAVAEAQEVLSQLTVQGASLLQVKKAKKSLEKVQQKISKNVEGSMVKALLALTTGEFANSEALQKVADLLAQVAGNLVGSVAKYTQEETEAQQSFEADMSAKTAELNNFSLELSQAQDQLQTTIETIADNEEFLAQRQEDLANFEQDMVDENNNFDRITEIFEDLIAQLGVERKACLEALDILNSSDIAGYIGGRMSQDVIIDQPHGTGFNVEAKFDEFQ